MLPESFRSLLLAVAAMTVATTAAVAAPSVRPHVQTARGVACQAPANLESLDHALDRTTRRLAAGNSIKIVAFGSSSTAGAGASSPEHSYPSRLAVELRKLFPGHSIVVLNRGLNGDEDTDMLARLDTDVLAAKPDLVLWQVGTNSLLRDRDLKADGVTIHEGVERIKASGADAILIDPQFAPEVIAKAESGHLVSLIAGVAKEDDVGLFRRYAVMQNWREASGIPFRTFISPDHLHMNDWGYGCLAKILAGAIAEVAPRPIVAARAIAR